MEPTRVIRVRYKQVQCCSRHRFFAVFGWWSELSAFVYSYDYVFEYQFPTLEIQSCLIADDLPVLLDRQ